MGKQVQVNSPYTRLWLYAGGVFDAGATATLTDAEWAALGTVGQGRVTVTNPSVPDPDRSGATAAPESSITGLVSDLAAKQPLDADLTAVAGLTPTTDNVIQSVSGAWASRTPAQVKSTLALAKGDVGLSNVDNTSDANKPVSTAQQTALNLKSNVSMGVNAQTGTSYTLVLADADGLVTMTNAAASTLTVPPNSSVAFPVGTRIHIAQRGAGQVTIVQGAGVTVENSPGLKIASQYGTAAIVKVATDTWISMGRLSA